MSGVLQLTLLAWCAFVGLGSAACLALHPVLRRRLVSLGPASRARAISLFAAAPLLVASGLAAGCFLPSLVSRLLGLSDHCASHDDVHAHFCWLHPVRTTGSTSGWVLVAIVLGLLGALIATDVTRLARGWRRARDLARGATSLPMAFTIGLLRPRAVVRQGLVDALPGPLLHAVVAHEEAHVARRDNLRKVVTGLVARLHAPSVRARLLGDLELACEEACDLHAAEVTGDALTVAEAILAAERLCRAPDELPVVAFGDGLVCARVEALLRRDQTPVTDERALAPWLLLLGVSTLVAAVPLHDAIEDLVSLLGR